jgi:hypothetical protein
MFSAPCADGVSVCMHACHPGDDDTACGVKGV